MFSSNNLFIVLLSLFLLLVPSLASAQSSNGTENTNSEFIDNINTSEPAVVDRVWIDLAFWALYDGVTFTTGIIPIISGISYGISSSYKNELEDSTYNHSSTEDALLSLGSIILLSTTIMPAFAVRTSDRIMGGHGSIGWTYAGSVIGSVAGAGIGAVAFLFNDIAGIFSTTISSLVFGIVGAILGYELTDKKYRESSQNAISNLHPVIEFSEDKKFFGFGFNF